MALNRTSGAPLLAPEQVAELVVRPLVAESVALRTATFRQTDRSEYRIPVMSALPGGGWVDEASPIDLTDASFTSVVVRPTKVAAISVVSSEEVDDAEIDPLNALGDGLVAKLAQNLDGAWFGDLPAPAQAGLQALAAANGSEVQTVSAGSNFTSLDPFAEAASKIEQAGGQVTSFVAGPTTALSLAKIKAATGSQVPLLAPNSDAAQPTRRTIEGRPLYVSAAVPAGVVWALDGSTSFVVLRKGATLDVDRSAFFSTDQVALRLTCRVGFGYAAPSRIVRIATS
ncbi:phage major capsid protein [Streptomyces sp. NP160]|uniref:phage major capsid protein n=1 Tax=Streptomyces sp. NP160 TaxID=2586637 RepID=UPI0015D5EE53|nr:phage major capsid protein [Streptomyces sp. NP160]